VVGLCFVIKFVYRCNQRRNRRNCKAAARSEDKQGDEKPQLKQQVPECRTDEFSLDDTSSSEDDDDDTDIKVSINNSNATNDNKNTDIKLQSLKD